MEISGKARNMTMQIKYTHEERRTKNTIWMPCLQVDQKDKTEHLHSLEEKIVIMRQQILAAKNRTIIVEKRAEETTRRTWKTVGHLTRHFNNY